MDELKVIALNNLKLLIDLKEDEVIISHRRTIQKQDEYVQVDNICELEYALFFTIHYLLTMEYDEIINRKSLLNDIDKVINNIYNNENINKLVKEDDIFWDLMKSMDTLYHNVKENFNKSLCTILLDRFVNYTRVVSYFMKQSIFALNEYNKHVHFAFLSSDEEEEEEAEQQEEEEVEHPEEDNETGEENPNLIYDKKEE